MGRREGGSSGNLTSQVHSNCSFIRKFRGINLHFWLGTGDCLYQNAVVDIQKLVSLYRYEIFTCETLLTQEHWLPQFLGYPNRFLLDSKWTLPSFLPEIVGFIFVCTFFSQSGMIISNYPNKHPFALRLACFPISTIVQ